MAVQALRYYLRVTSVPQNKYSDYLITSDFTRNHSAIRESCTSVSVLMEGTYKTALQCLQTEPTSLLPLTVLLRQRICSSYAAYYCEHPTHVTS